MDLQRLGGARPAVRPATVECSFMNKSLTLWMLSGGFRCLKPPRGALLTEVTNFIRAQRSSLLISETTCTATCCIGNLLVLMEVFEHSSERHLRLAHLSNSLQYALLRHISHFWQRLTVSVQESFMSISSPSYAMYLKGVPSRRA